MLCEMRYYLTFRNRYLRNKEPALCMCAMIHALLCYIDDVMQSSMSALGDNTFMLYFSSAH